MKKFKGLMLGSSAIWVAFLMSGCATVKSGRDYIVTEMCKSRDDLIRAALIAGDIQTAEAIKIYCPAPIPASVSGT